MEHPGIEILLGLRDDTPLVEQIAGQLRRQIELGAILPGTRLPPVRDMARQLNVNFNTVARAYRILDKEGWVLTRQGQGTFVSEHSQQEEQPVEVEEAQAQEAEEEPLSVQEQMDRLVKAMEALAQSAGLGMVDVIAHIQGTTIEGATKSSRGKSKRRKTLLRRGRSTYLSLLYEAEKKPAKKIRRRHTP